MFRIKKSMLILVFNQLKVALTCMSYSLIIESTTNITITWPAAVHVVAESPVLRLCGGNS